MAYKFTDRLKEWTSYAGIAGAGLAGVLPMIVPANHWVDIWQAVQMIIGGMLFFVPQTAGTTAIENDSWALLKAFTNTLPPEYAAGVQPLISTLAGHLARIESNAPPPDAPMQVVRMAAPQPQVVMAQPVPQPVMADALAQPMPTLNSVTPLVADPGKSLHTFG